MKSSRADRSVTAESGKKKRIAALTDGIYAIVMTILVLSIDIPKFPQETAAVQLPSYLRFKLWPEISKYVLAFITLAAFWIGHVQQYHHIKKIDSRLLWMNVFSLMLIALIPFTTAVAGDYATVGVADRIFELNLLIAGLMYYFHWSYATHNHRLVFSDLDPQHIARTKKAMLIIPILSLAALAISFLQPAWSTSVYILIPFLYHRDTIKEKLIGSKSDD